MNNHKIIIPNAGGIPEAPVDGKSYARKDADWVTLNMLINNDTENPRSIFLDTPFVNKPMMLSALKEPEQSDDGAALFIEPESIKSYILSTTNNGSIETIGLGNKTYQITDGSGTEILKTYKYTLDIEPETVIRKVELDNAIQQAIEDVLLGEV